MHILIVVCFSCKAACFTKPALPSWHLCCNTAASDLCIAPVSSWPQVTLNPVPSVWQAFASGSKKKRKRDGWDNKKGGKGVAALLWVGFLACTLMVSHMHWQHLLLRSIQQQEDIVVSTLKKLVNCSWSGVTSAEVLCPQIHPTLNVGFAQVITCATCPMSIGGVCG